MSKNCVGKWVPTGCSSPSHQDDQSVYNACPKSEWGWGKSKDLRSR